MSLMLGAPASRRLFGTMSSAVIFDVDGVLRTGRDVERGKADPQVLLAAAGRLGVEPASCVVIEDAAAGKEAASNAGMASVALVSTGHSAGELRAAGPDPVVRSLRELTPAILRAL